VEIVELKGKAKPVSSYGKNNKIDKKKRKKSCKRLKEVERAKCVISKYRG